MIVVQPVQRIEHALAQAVAILRLERPLLGKHHEQIKIAFRLPQQLLPADPIVNR
jgi:hypothetical protein